MKQKNKFSFDFDFFDQIMQLTEIERELVDAVFDAAEDAYAPYSGFKVGAAARLKNHQIIKASNMENAAYPQCLCAEQVLCATVKAQFNDYPIEKMAVYSPNWKEEIPLSPCGSCRQILLEKERRQQSDIEVFLVNAKGEIWKIPSVSNLLPFGFK